MILLMMCHVNINNSKMAFTVHKYVLTWPSLLGAPSATTWYHPWSLLGFLIYKRYACPVYQLNNYSL